MSAFHHIKRAVCAEPVAWIAGIGAIATTPLCAGRVSAQEYAACIDLHTLALLFSLMLVVAGLREEGILQRIACNLIARARDAQVLSSVLVACCFFGSMFVTNDVSLMVFVPLSYVSLRLANCSSHFLRTVVLQTVAANLGSSLSPVGNPQNIYLQAHYGLDLGTFASQMLPIVAAGAAGIAASVFVFLPARPIESVRFSEQQQGSRVRIAILALLFAASLACVAGLVPYWALLACTLAAALVMFRKLLPRIDYALLLTFVFFFVLVENLQHVDAVRDVLASVAGAHPFAASVAASQVISNVPAAVLLSGFTENGTALLAGTNVGGLGTPIASLASLISLKLYIQLASGKKKQARTGRYLLFFTAVNIALLAALCLLYSVGPVPHIS